MQKLLENLKLGEGATSMVLWVGLSVVLLVIVVSLAVWLVRTLRPNLNMSGGSGRGGRPQRLAITDAFNLDRDGRKLVIVRRDNTEHLLLIGGPNDVLIESGIIKNERAISGRERGRAHSEHDSALAAEAALSAELPRIDMPRAEAPAPPAPPVMSPPVMAPAAPPMRPAAPPPRPPVAPPAPAPVVAPAPPSAPTAADNVRLDEEFERALTSVLPTPPRPVTPPPAPAPVAPPVMAPPVAPPPAMPAPAVEPAAPPPPKKREPTSEMARRLNEVLQKPLSGTLRAPFNKPIPPVPATLNAGQPRLPDPPPAPAQSAPPPAPPSPPPAKPPLPELPDLPPAPPPLPPRQDMAPASPTTPAALPKLSTTDSEMDLLEEEMARLLGRPSQPNKPGAP